MPVAHVALLSSRFSIVISTNSLVTKLVPLNLMKAVFRCLIWNRSKTYKSIGSELTTTVLDAPLGKDLVVRGLRPRDGS
jgi:hypothetical protein